MPLTSSPVNVGSITSHMGKNNQTTTNSAPSAPWVNPVNLGQIELKETRYVVIRDGHRVSAQEYASPTDPKAQDELKFWKKVETNHSWGAQVCITEYDNRLHRVFSIH
jgi:hypothetical protein